MKQADYAKVGHQTYGTRCEWIGCGWDAAETDVHHINYQEHQAEEDRITKEKNSKVHIQLPKSTNMKDLSVLCPNHHRYTHAQDLGLKILQYIPPRKDDNK